MTVHIVASCTDRKRASVPDDLRVRELAGGSVEHRLGRWLAKLAASTATAKPARALYGGEHWKLVLEIEQQLHEDRGEVELSVASAGYGLVSADALLKPYSATFAARQPDSVAQNQDDRSFAWWDGVCAGRDPQISLQTLAAGAESLVVIASAKYLRAMLPDLMRARALLPDPGNLIVFAGSKLDELGSSLIRVDARVQVALKKDDAIDKLRGTKQGLAARTAKELLCGTRTWPPTTATLRKAYEDLVADVAPPPAYERARHDDDGPIRAFIASALNENPRAGWTGLLRAWRAQGQACEQSRFRRLHREVQTERA